jgi:hypothetical protein
MCQRRWLHVKGVLKYLSTVSAGTFLGQLQYSERALRLAVCDANSVCKFVCQVGVDSEKTARPMFILKIPLEILYSLMFNVHCLHSSSKESG